MATLLSKCQGPSNELGCQNTTSTHRNLKALNHTSISETISTCIPYVRYNVLQPKKYDNDDHRAQGGMSSTIYRNKTTNDLTSGICYSYLTLRMQLCACHCTRIRTFMLCRIVAQYSVLISFTDVHVHSRHHLTAETHKEYHMG